jgi:hypothetical protein
MEEYRVINILLILRHNLQPRPYSALACRFLILRQSYKSWKQLNLSQWSLNSLIFIRLRDTYLPIQPLSGPNKTVLVGFKSDSLSIID